MSGKALAAGEDNNHEIEAISILYSRPHSVGLRYGQVKELARRLSIKPFHVGETRKSFHCRTLKYAGVEGVTTRVPAVTENSFEWRLGV